MKFVLFFILLICFLKSQEYKLSCFGIHIADIKQSIYEIGEIKYEIQSRGITDLIWPTNNNYYASFDSATFEFCTKFSNVGSNVNVITNEVNNPKVIIHPKSIIGFISLKINDIKAHIVVKTV